MSDETIDIQEIMNDIKCKLDTVWDEDYSDEYSWEDWLINQLNETNNLDVEDTAALLENHCGGLIMVIANKYNTTLDAARELTHEAIKLDVTILGLDNLFDDNSEE